MSYPSPFDRDVITPVQQFESNFVEIKGLYRHLKKLDCEVLLPELYKIVIDYVVDAPDYEELKTAFMKTSRYEGLDIGDNLMEVWREAVLRRNTYDRAESKMYTCDMCSIQFYTRTVGNFFCTGDAGHQYHMCLCCHIKVNPDQDDDLYYSRRCRDHPVTEEIERLRRSVADQF